MANSTLSYIDSGGYRYSIGDIIKISSNWYQDLDDTSPSPNDISAYLSDTTFKIIEIYNLEANSSWKNPIHIQVVSSSNLTIGGTGMIRVNQIVSGSGGTPLFTVGTTSVSAYDNRNNSYPSTGGWFESVMLNWSGFSSTSDYPIQKYRIYYKECADGGNTPDGNWSGWVNTGLETTSTSYRLGSVDQTNGNTSSNWGTRNKWFQWSVVAVFNDDNTTNASASATSDVLRKSQAYKQTFNANGGSGTAPSTQYKFTSYDFVFPSNPFSKTGYAFSGWSTNSSATSGHAAGARIASSTVGDATHTWYATWIGNTYYIKYNANGGTGSMSNSTHVYGTAKALTANTFTRTGYTFNGWNTKQDGSGTALTDKHSITGLTTTAGATVNIYAQWKVIEYPITYTLNGGTVSIANPTSYNVETATFKLNNPTKTGYTFAGWTGSNVSTPSTSVSITKGSTGAKSYTANWTVHKLTVNYYSNYATEANFADNYELLNEVSKDINVLVHSREFKYDTEYSTGLHNYSESGNVLYMKRLGYTATGNWGTSPAGGTLIGEDDSFSSGQAMAEKVGLSLASGNASINLYAQWDPANIAFYRIDGEWKLCHTYIKVGGVWKPAIMYKKINGTWKRSVLK